MGLEELFIVELDITDDTEAVSDHTKLENIASLRITSRNIA
jgi:hypothetical protein